MSRPKAGPPLSRIMEAGRGDPAGAVEGKPLHLEQGPLHGRSALEAAEAAVGADRPVAGDDQGKGVRRQGVADRPAGSRLAEKGGDETVGADAPPRDPVFGSENRLLERRARPQGDEVEGEDDRLAAEEGPDPVGHRLDLGARGGPGAGEKG